MMTPAPIIGRDIKPANMPRAAGKRSNTCSKCGFVGGNARGCGTSHPTRPEQPPPAMPEIAAAVHAVYAAKPLTAIEPTRNLKPTPAAVAAAKERIARLDAIKARSGGVVLTPSRRAPAVDDNPTARERWTDSEIAVETSQAEMHKQDGAMPAPSSSWDLEHGHGETGMATAIRTDRDDPEELNFEDVG